MTTNFQFKQAAVAGDTFTDAAASDVIGVQPSNHAGSQHPRPYDVSNRHVTSTKHSVHAT